ncbi:MarR family transcriptional regulator [Amycolatopsis ultiminotia]|uniref:MarR family transcriptional regulator n=1 Tax=Amycolatopsis ultiminotia TaxID=543629 RepID=A0ABP6V4X3_9PSEU
MTAGQLPRLGVADTLVRTAHRVQRIFADVSRSFDLTPQQAQLLCRLTEGAMTMTELCAALNLEKSSLTGLVDRIEARSLVHRIRHPQDRRMVRVDLTGEGAKLAHAVHDAVAGSLDALVARLAGTDDATITAALTPLVTDNTTNA